MKIEDEHSGIKDYRATINGKWVLMEYDYKKNSLVYDFSDGVIKNSENNLKIIVTDNMLEIILHLKQPFLENS